MATTLKTHHIRAINASLAAIEALHTSTLKDGPSVIDHTPYERLHDSDVEGDCPVCSALTHVKAVRAVLAGEAP